jgi:hypothetical protein
MITPRPGPTRSPGEVPCGVYCHTQATYSADAKAGAVAQMSETKQPNRLRALLLRLLLGITLVLPAGALALQMAPAHAIDALDEPLLECAKEACSCSADACLEADPELVSSTQLQAAQSQAGAMVARVKSAGDETQAAVEASSEKPRTVAQAALASLQPASEDHHGVADGKLDHVTALVHGAPRDAVATAKQGIHVDGVAGEAIERARGDAYRAISTAEDLASDGVATACDWVAWGGQVPARIIGAPSQPQAMPISCSNVRPLES